MFKKLIKEEYLKQIYVERDWNYFFVLIFFSLITVTAFFFFTSYDFYPVFVFTSFVFVIGAYFSPSIAAYDLISNYQEKYNAPQIKHPYALLILILNLLLGWTIVAWLILLFFAVKPGNVKIVIVEYKNENESN